MQEVYRNAIDAAASAIFTDAEEQSNVAEAINRNVLNISQISDDTATASEHTFAASEGLARLGGQLKVLVATFKI